MRHCLFVVLEADVGHKGFDDVNFLQRRHDQQLQIDLLEKPQPIFGGLIRAAAEGLVDDDEAERTWAHRTPAPAQTAKPGRRPEWCGPASLSARLICRLNLNSAHTRGRLRASVQWQQKQISCAHRRPWTSSADQPRPCLRGRKKHSMMRFTCRNFASENWASSDPVSAPSVQARSSVWKSRTSTSIAACASSSIKRPGL